MGIDYQPALIVPESRLESGGIVGMDNEGQIRHCGVLRNACRIVRGFKPELHRIRRGVVKVYKILGKIVAAFDRLGQGEIFGEQNKLSCRAGA